MIGRVFQGSLWTLADAGGAPHLVFSGLLCRSRRYLHYLDLIAKICKFFLIVASSIKLERC
eukprot:3945324-Ditylum_brightwellii.AAC.1